MSFDYIREEGKAGRMAQRLMAVVCEGTRGRVYISPLPEHEDIASQVEADDYPVTDLPEQALGFRVQLYGMDQHWKLFTPRQLTALTTFSDLVKEAREQVLADAMQAGTLPDDDRPFLEGRNGPQAYADAVATYLGFVVNKMADLGNALNRWEPNAQCPRQLFARQAIPMVWDFAEGNPFSESSGSWNVLFRNLSNAFASPLFDYDRQGGAGVIQKDATATATYAANPIVSTDPPYYDNIGYADLSDFF